MSSVPPVAQVGLVNPTTGLPSAPIYLPALTARMAAAKTWYKNILATRTVNPALVTPHRVGTVVEDISRMGLAATLSNFAFYPAYNVFRETPTTPWTERFRQAPLQHVLKSVKEGGRGAFVAAPSTLALYGLAPMCVLKVENLFRSRGYSEKSAELGAALTTLVGGVGLFESAIEAGASRVPVRNWRPLLMLTAAGAIGVRVLFSVGLPYAVVSDPDQSHDLSTTAAIAAVIASGTTFPQWLVSSIWEVQRKGLSEQVKNQTGLSGSFKRAAESRRMLADYMGGGGDRKVALRRFMGPLLHRSIYAAALATAAVAFKQKKTEKV